MSKKIKKLRNFNSLLRSVNQKLTMEIIQRKAAENKLKTAYQQLSDIIEFLPDATFVIDKNRTIIAWNKAIEEMTGVKKAEMVGKSDYAYAVTLFGQDRPLLMDMAMNPEKEIEPQYNFIKRINGIIYAEVFVSSLYSGKGAYIWIKAQPLFDSEKNIVGAVESIRDITARKEAEAILQRDKDSFENLTKERTKQLLEVQKKLADAKHLSEIGSLAATVAHELRNPLAAIRTAAYNISKKSSSPRLKSHLSNIEKKVLESNQIINNLLSYSRIKVPHFEEVKICKILEECIDAAKDRYYKWDVKLTKKLLCRKNDIINADPYQMRELFNNLLNNGYESFLEKKGKLVIFAQYQSPPGFFTASFSDNGIGISPGDLKKLAEPFFTTKSKGTGLGLTVCQQLVRLHEGKLDFQSEIGKGTQVTVTLPIERKPA
jgi:two-component system, cell cycle sensor histidine kinase and response regulator CckA